MASPFLRFLHTLMIETRTSCFANITCFCTTSAALVGADPEPGLSYQELMTRELGRNYNDFHSSHLHSDHLCSKIKVNCSQSCTPVQVRHLSVATIYIFH